MDLTQNDWTINFNKENDAVILDVRTSEEFEEGFIENAINIDIYKGQGFIYELENLDKNKNYYVYCKAGGRSAQACSIMKEMGFQNAFNLIGGMLNWKGKTVKL
ncbi:MAG: rhodanese-like domain-containing protein [Flavobacterium sp.]|nr:rhodanese-like domain-containing protein [Flavobacterium sp.]